MEGYGGLGVIRGGFEVICGDLGRYVRVWEGFRAYGVFGGIWGGFGSDLGDMGGLGMIWGI